MAVDPRDQIWEATFSTYYSIYYEEMVADALIARWQWVDDVTKVLVALTATGSAITGWALWQNPDLKWLWSIIAGVSAVLAVVHGALGVPGRLKDLGNNRSMFTALRIDLETFRYRMQVDPEFAIDQFTKELIAFRKRFGEAIGQVRGDVMLTDNLRNGTQAELNERLANIMISN